jgi:hypothetical protein
VTPSAALFGYSPGGAVLTLVLPLGLFTVVMIGMTVVFRPRQAVPARRPAGPDAARGQPDDEDTAVHDTLVSDTAGHAGTPDSAVSPQPGGDTANENTVAEHPE